MTLPECIQFFKPLYGTGAALPDFCPGQGVSLSQYFFPQNSRLQRDVRI